MGVKNMWTIGERGEGTEENEGGWGGGVGGKEGIVVK